MKFPLLKVGLGIIGGGIAAGVAGAAAADWWMSRPKKAAAGSAEQNHSAVPQKKSEQKPKATLPEKKNIPFADAMKDFQQKSEPPKVEFSTLRFIKNALSSAVPQAQSKKSKDDADYKDILNKSMFERDKEAAAKAAAEKKRQELDAAKKKRDEEQKRKEESQKQQFDKKYAELDAQGKHLDKQANAAAENLRQERKLAVEKEKEKIKPEKIGKILSEFTAFKNIVDKINREGRVSENMVRKVNDKRAKIEKGMMSYAREIGRDDFYYDFTEKFAPYMNDAIVLKSMMESIKSGSEIAERELKQFMRSLSGTYSEIRVIAGKAKSEHNAVIIQEAIRKIEYLIGEEERKLEQVKESFGPISKVQDRHFDNEASEHFDGFLQNSQVLIDDLIDIKRNITGTKVMSMSLSDYFVPAAGIISTGVIGAAVYAGGKRLWNKPAEPTLAVVPYSVLWREPKQKRIGRKGFESINTAHDKIYGKLKSVLEYDDEVFSDENKESIAEKKRLEEEKRLADEKRLTEEKRLADEKRIEDEKMLENKRRENETKALEASPEYQRQMYELFDKNVKESVGKLRLPTFFRNTK